MSQKKSFVEFSNDIIQSGDIDPDYIFMINFAKEYGEKRAFELFKLKLLIYNLGSELLFLDKKIGERELVFGNERAKGKRNFSTWKAVLDRINIDVFRKYDNVDYLSFRANFTKIPGMGDWASWKAADILAKVFNINILYNDRCFLGAYEFPLRGLLMVNNAEENTSMYKNVFLFDKHFLFAKQAVSGISPTIYFDARKTPELETCLCKYHSYIHNKYKVGQDLHHVRSITKDERLIQYKKLLP